MRVLEVSEHTVSGNRTGLLNLTSMDFRMKDIPFADNMSFAFSGPPSVFPTAFIHTILPDSKNRTYRTLLTCLHAIRPMQARPSAGRVNTSFVIVPDSKTKRRHVLKCIMVTPDNALLPETGRIISLLNERRLCLFCGRNRSRLLDPMVVWVCGPLCARREVVGRSWVAECTLEVLRFIRMARNLRNWYRRGHEKGAPRSTTFEDF